MFPSQFPFQFEQNSPNTKINFNSIFILISCFHPLLLKLTQMESKLFSFEGKSVIVQAGKIPSEDKITLKANNVVTTLVIPKGIIAKS